MISKIRSNKAAFTLVEIMIVVAIIGLLAALAIPGFVKARKQSQGRRSLNDARQIDSAIDQWAIEKKMKVGDTIVLAEVATYVKGGLPSADAVNNAFVISTTLAESNNVAISTSTKSALDGVGIEWGTY
ncbi:MAG: hypothetical protein PCFJNLEI_04169 [Verrucomicrobiae bacterium]|nr:hypothetical protein [Verrucomicrobiae bacterium]